RQAIANACEALRNGRSVALAIAGEVVRPSSRDRVQAMARAAAALLPYAGTCILTGGDTARALFDELRVSQLEIVGEWEPGISLARIAAAATPGFVLKAGGFGDAQALGRIIAYFGGSRRAATARDSASS
ncbi:MAG TPA: nucleotide-binding domain containing protein, partial [Ramlibacter sp.]|nr:nucleotide-binding domain containing protein [Ramlibacter sp.]